VGQHFQRSGQYFQRPKYERHVKAVPDKEHHDLYLRAAEAFLDLLEEYQRAATIQIGNQSFDFTKPLYWTGPPRPGTVRVHRVPSAQYAASIGVRAQEENAAGMDRKESAEEAIERVISELPLYEKYALFAIVVHGHSTLQVGPKLHRKGGKPKKNADADWTYCTLQSVLWKVALKLGLAAPEGTRIRATPPPVEQE
jgi:hypothetical protein